MRDFFFNTGDFNIWKKSKKIARAPQRLSCARNFFFWKQRKDIRVVLDQRISGLSSRIGLILMHCGHETFVILFSISVREETDEPIRIEFWNSNLVIVFRILNFEFESIKDKSFPAEMKNRKSVRGVLILAKPIAFVFLCIHNNTKSHLQPSRRPKQPKCQWISERFCWNSNGFCSRHHFFIPKYVFPSKCSQN